MTKWNRQVPSSLYHTKHQTHTHKHIYTFPDDTFITCLKYTIPSKHKGKKSSITVEKPVGHLLIKWSKWASSVMGSTPRMHTWKKAVKQWEAPSSAFSESPAKESQAESNHKEMSEKSKLMVILHSNWPLNTNYKFIGRKKISFYSLFSSKWKHSPPGRFQQLGGSSYLGKENKREMSISWWILPTK